MFERAWKLQNRIEKSLSRRKYKRPFAEWRLPVQICLVSSVIFVLFTAMFGISINTQTGMPEYYLAPGDDWENPIVDNDGDLAMYSERGGNNPMRQFPDWIYLAMVIGYYVTVGFFIWGYFEYCKWKWDRIPLVLRYEKREPKEVKQQKTSFYK